MMRNHLSSETHSSTDLGEKGTMLHLTVGPERFKAPGAGLVQVDLS